VNLMQTYVWHENKRFFVSTMRRQSSAAVIPATWYAETYAWDQQNGDVVAQAAEGPAFKQHMDVVKQLLETGVYNERE